MRLTPGLDSIIPPAAEISILARGFEWSEGPLWLPDQQLLIFSDVPRNTIYAWPSLEEGADPTATQVYLQPSGYTGEAARGGEPGSNGLALDQQDRLLLCQHGDRRIARMEASLGEPAPSFETVAGRYEGMRFNSPNDLCINQAGQVFFTDPPYGLPHGPEDSLLETPFQGVYRIDPDGSVSLLVDSLTRPNGIALSPDERTLYVAVSDPTRAIWMAYDLGPKGQVQGGRLFYDATDWVGRDNPGLPDGLKVGPDGTLFATGPGGVWVFSPQGEQLGLLRTGRPTSNCALGDGFLYMTADSLLLRTPVYAE